MILGVVGYAFWHYKGDDVRQVGGRQDRAATAGDRRRGRLHGRLRRAEECAHPIPSAAMPAARASPRPTSGQSGKLARPLVVGINTWAGHAPGIVVQRRPRAERPARLTRSEYGLDVKFVLLEDPAAKLAAFRKGDVDIMWDTVDYWAREASILAEQNQKAKSIIHAGLVARRRRHRLARDASSPSKI